jgi:hypothetical protein
VSIDKSDNRCVHANGRNGSTFVVRGYFGLNHGWRICEFKSENSIVSPELPPIEGTPNVTDNQEDEGGKGKGDKDGDGDDSGSDDDENSTPSNGKGKDKKRKMHSLIKSRWMVPLIKQAIKQRPNMSNNT